MSKPSYPLYTPLRQYEYVTYTEACGGGGGGGGVPQLQLVLLQAELLHVQVVGVPQPDAHIAVLTACALPVVQLHPPGPQFTLGEEMPTPQFHPDGFPNSDALLEQAVETEAPEEIVNEPVIGS